MMWERCRRAPFPRAVEDRIELVLSISELRHDTPFYASAPEHKQLEVLDTAENLGSSHIILWHRTAGDEQGADRQFQQNRIEERYTDVVEEEIDAIRA